MANHCTEHAENTCASYPRCHGCGAYSDKPLESAEENHGYWDDSFDGITPYCSVCGRSHRLMVRTPATCPHCDAVMDLEMPAKEG